MHTRTRKLHTLTFKDLPTFKRIGSWQGGIHLVFHHLQKLNHLNIFLNAKTQNTYFQASQRKSRLQFLQTKAAPLCLERDSVTRLVTPFLFEEKKTRPKYSLTNL